MIGLTQSVTSGNVRTRRRSRWFAVAVVLLAAGTAAIWVRVALEPVTVRVGFSLLPPYLDKGPDGKPTGFSADMLEQAARRANIKLRWVEIPASLDVAISQRLIDLYPLISITQDRKIRFHMSEPWWETQYSLVSIEGREIGDVGGANGKRIAARIGAIKSLPKNPLPGAQIIDTPVIAEMEAKLCGGAVDGFYTDALLLDSKLLRHSSLCSGLAPHIFPVPDAKLFFGTMSTKAARAINDRLVREIGEFAVDGTLERTAAKWGVFTPYDPTRLKQVADAERRQTQMAWALGVALLVLSVSVIQTKAIYRAKRNVERAQAEAKDLQSRFDQFMRHTPAITFIKDERKRLVYSNEQFCCNWAPEGGGREARNGGNTAGSISGLLCDRDDDVIETGVGVEVTEMLRGSDGRERHFLVAKFPFRGDGGARFLGGVALDVTDRVLAEKELEYQASRDPLTGLPNRRSFMAELKLALEEAQGRGEYVAVGFVDLDRFKRVNDLMGHEAGDKLLKQAAARLRKICGEFDMVARLGGDEFTAMIRRAQPEQVRKAMQQALSSLEEPFRIDGEEVLISASIGVSMFPEHGNTSQQLLRRAANAMYWAKARGKRRVHFWTPEGEDEAFGEVPEKREMGYAAEPQSALGALSRAS